jgi:hypothetical protein
MAKITKKKSETKNPPAKVIPKSVAKYFNVSSKVLARLPDENFNWRKSERVGKKSTKTKYKKVIIDPNKTTSSKMMPYFKSVIKTESRQENKTARKTNLAKNRGEVEKKSKPNVK